MDDLLSLLLFFLALAIVMSLAIGWGFYKLLAQKGYRNSARLITCLLVLGLGYVVYTALYPEDDFYEAEFHAITNLAFPDSGKIQQKAASYPDIHGDYVACAVLTLPPSEYYQVLRHISRDDSFSAHEFSSDSTFVTNEEFQKVTAGIPKASYHQEFSKRAKDYDYMFIGFLKDQKTVVVYHIDN